MVKTYWVKRLAQFFFRYIKSGEWAKWYNEVTVFLINVL